MDLSIEDLKNLFSLRLINGKVWDKAVEFNYLRLDCISELPQDVYDKHALAFSELLNNELRVILELYDFIDNKMGETNFKQMKLGVIQLKFFHNALEESVGKYDEGVRLDIMNHLENLFPALLFIEQYLSELKLEHINSVHEPLGSKCKCEWCKRNPYSTSYDKSLKPEPVAHKPLIVGHVITYF